MYELTAPTRAIATTATAAAFSNGDPIAVIGGVHAASHAGGGLDPRT